MRFYLQKGEVPEHILSKYNARPLVKKGKAAFLHLSVSILSASIKSVGTSETDKFEASDFHLVYHTTSRCIIFVVSAHETMLLSIVVG